MNSIKDRDGPCKKRKGPRRIEPQRAAPRQEKRDTQPAFAYGNGLGHDGQTPPFDPTGKPERKPENGSPDTLLRDTSSMAGAYFARTRLVVIGGLNPAQTYQPRLAGPDPSSPPRTTPAKNLECPKLRS